MKFRTDSEALAILNNTRQGKVYWIAAFDHLMNHASSHARLNILDRFNTLPREQQTEIRRLVEIYRDTNLHM